MDPTACYHEMICSMNEGNHHVARAYAHSLRAWLICGGFYPIDGEILDVDGHVARVLRITTPGAPKEPEVFSLTCADCDDGSHIHSEAEAIKEGWTRIRPQPDLAKANYLGVCPFCRKKVDQEES
jgi:hypothetical protein